MFKVSGFECWDGVVDMMNNNICIYHRYYDILYIA